MKIENLTFNFHGKLSHEYQHYSHQLSAFMPPQVMAARPRNTH